jgi:hypothetical protein
MRELTRRDGHGLAGRADANRPPGSHADGQLVASGADCEADGALGPLLADAAARNDSGERGGVRHRAARDLVSPNISSPVPGLPFAFVAEAAERDYRAAARAGKPDTVTDLL